MAAVTEGPMLWEPPAERRAASRMADDTALAWRARTPRVRRLPGAVAVVRHGHEGGRLHAIPHTPEALLIPPALRLVCILTLSALQGAMGDPPWLGAVGLSGFTLRS